MLLKWLKPHIEKDEKQAKIKQIKLKKLEEQKEFKKNKSSWFFKDRYYKEKEFERRV